MLDTIALDIWKNLTKINDKQFKFYSCELDTNSPIKEANPFKEGWGKGGTRKDERGEKYMFRLALLCVQRHFWELQ